MKWTLGADSKRIIRTDWAKTDYLRHVDPYLVWFDITGFGGTSLLAGDRLPMIEQRRGPVPQYATSLRSVDDLAAFLETEFGPERAVERFEVAPGIVNDNARPESVEPAGGSVAGAVRPRGRRRVVGFIDYGCAFAHRSFRRAGPGLQTRVLAIWDQAGAVVPPRPPDGLDPLQWRTPPDFGYGSETHRERRWRADAAGLPLGDYMAQPHFMRSGAFDEEACYRYSGYAPVVNSHASHGTHIMDVATGWPNPLRKLLSIAPDKDRCHDEDIVFVQLPRQVRGRSVGGLLRAHVYDGLRFIESCAPKNASVVVNLSYGGYAGPHDGSSILESAIDDFLRTHRTASRRFDLVIPSGNARNRRLHARADLDAWKTATFEWNNLPDDPSDSFVEIWLPRQAGFAIRITAPGGRADDSPWLTPGTAGSLLRPAGSNDGVPLAALVFPERACQSGTGTMALFATGPTRLGAGRPAAPYGGWTIEVHNRSGASATVHAWCELDSPAFGTEDLPRQAYFSQASGVDRDGTLNGIAHGLEPIVVGGHALDGDVAGYSGTGPGRGAAPGSRTRHVARNGMSEDRRGPEAVAPSDESTVIPGLLAAAVIGTDTVRLNGTSVAAAAMTRRILDGHQPRLKKQDAEAGAVESQLRAKRPVSGREPHPDNDLLPRRR